MVNHLMISHLASQVREFGHSHFTGGLTIQLATTQQWCLFFRLGRLVWATGGTNRFRRWQRLTQAVNPVIDPMGISLHEQDITWQWEYQMLNAMTKRNQFSREQAAAVIKANIGEVVFDILQASESSGEVADNKITQDNLGEIFTVLNAEQVLRKVGQVWAAWCNAGLTHYSPNMAPVIKHPEELRKQVSANTYKQLTSLIDGNTTFRDLSIVMKQDVLVVMRSLIPYAQRGLFGLQNLDDLLPPRKFGTSFLTTNAGNKPLIACIDDSPKVCQVMEQILRAAGYEFIAIQDSVQALPILLERKPSLIFLDLVMPVANGYEICSQIRRVSALKSIPVVILTGNDGIVDRVRAKMVGATDFLTKPTEINKVLAVIQRHLVKEASPENGNFHYVDQASTLTV